MPLVLPSVTVHLVVGGADPGKGRMMTAQVVPAFHPGEGGRAQLGGARAGVALHECELVGPEPRVERVGHADGLYSSIGFRWI